MWKPEDMSPDPRVHVLGRSLPLSPELRFSWVTKNRQIISKILWSLSYLFMEVSDPVSGECYRHNMQYDFRMLHTRSWTHTHTNTCIVCAYMFYMHAYMCMHTNIHTYTMVALWNWILLISYLFTLYLSISVIIITQGNELHDYALFLFLNSSNYLTVLNKYFRENISKL